MLLGFRPSQAFKMLVLFSDGSLGGPRQLRRECSPAPGWPWPYPVWGAPGGCVCLPCPRDSHFPGPLRARAPRAAPRGYSCVHMAVQ